MFTSINRSRIGAFVLNSIFFYIFRQHIKTNFFEKPHTIKVPHTNSFKKRKREIHIDSRQPNNRAIKSRGTQLLRKVATPLDLGYSRAARPLLSSCTYNNKPTMRLGERESAACDYAPRVSIVSRCLQENMKRGKEGACAWEKFENAFIRGEVCKAA